MVGGQGRGGERKGGEGEVLSEIKMLHFVIYEHE